MKKEVLYAVTAMIIASMFFVAQVVNAKGNTEPTPEQVIAKYVSAIGGEAAIEMLATRQVRGHVYTDLSWHDPQIEIQRFNAVYSGSQCYAFKLDDGTETSMYGFDGTSEWRFEEGAAETLDGDGRGKVEWLLNPRGVLMLDHYYPGLTLTGSKDVYGHDCWVLQPGDRDTTYYAMYFAKDTGLLLAVGYHWFISDYREIDGVLVPFRIECGRKGGAVNYVVDSIVHNVAVEDSMFAAPAG